MVSLKESNVVSITKRIQGKVERLEAAGETDWDASYLATDLGPPRSVTK